jgi:hypothetical protein
VAALSPADVVCPEGGGLQLARDGIELNLNGHSVTGPGAGTDSSGVFFAARDVTVRNGTISGWGTGITANYSDDDGPVSVSGTVREARLQGNGVGVDSAETAWFVISDDAVSFGRLARFFRDVLHCPNALYLDGSVSSLWDRPAGRRDTNTELGPLVAIFEREGRD